jgi:DNA-binding NarL/FixJ family response regulator
METERQTRQVLIVGGYAVSRESLALALSVQAAFAVKHCASAAEALQSLAEHRADVVLLDCGIGQQHCRAFLAGLKAKDRGARVLVVATTLTDHEAR